MKFRLFTLLMITTLLLGLTGVQPTQAAAYGTQFVTSITYQNVGTGPATITVDFYAEGNAAPITITLDPLAKGAGTSLFIGGVSQVSAGFRGSAVMSSDQPLVATLVQLPPGTSSVKNRPLSNGFSGGAPFVMIPTVLKNVFGSTSVFTVQNADEVGADLTLVFTPVSGTSFTKTVTNLPSGAAKYYDLGTEADVPATFNGSVSITAKKTGTQQDGSVIATSMELGVANDSVYAFEGISQSANTFYMPSAFCDWSARQQNSAYAVQNAGTSGNASVTVTYSNGIKDGPVSIAPGAKTSFTGCKVNPAGFIGSATITSTGAPIVAIGKVTGSGLSTAFLGVGSGANKIALPYVRWTEAQWLNGGRQRGNVAIQNVGGSSIPAGSIMVKYYNNVGTLVGTHTINTALAVGAKTNSNPMATGVASPEFGYWGSQFGGSAIVEAPAGSQLAVIVRIETYMPSTGATVGEDYNGIPIP